MSNCGKYVRAPLADEDFNKGEISEDQNDICSLYSDDFEVAAHETVETEDQSLVEPGTINEEWGILRSSPKKPTCEANPSTNKNNESDKHDLEDTVHSEFAERASNVRWDLIPKFPKDIPSNKLWENWQSFIDNFEIAASLSTFSRSADRAKLLYLSIGKNLQDIINAANLQPDYRDPRCYSNLVTGINNYFKSMTDTAAEHEAFQSMRQAKGETIVMFHAQLTQKVRLCGYSPADQVRFVLAQLLKGMQNRELALTARTYGHDAAYIVQAATRVEAYQSSRNNVENDASEVLAVYRKREHSRERQIPQKIRKIEGNKVYGKHKLRGSSLDYRQTQRNRCWKWIYFP
ncbi:uncharacterized protein LOC134214900 [Armigeres subalbatus]|uniref:uncharacterized protein LOC134214900 n=1 Tax=Armigeres subalbatus TaxID=124917 RepID=UPI002ED4A246